MLRDRAIAAEAGLRSGQFAVVFDYGNGTKSAATVAFDLGDGQRPAGLQVILEFQGATGTRRSEAITIGERSWQRDNGGPWVAVPSAGSVAEQLAAYLPRLAAVPPPATDGDPASGTLRWRAAQDDLDNTLRVDPATGVPGQLRQVSPSRGSSRTVTYGGWNTPVQIAAPADR